MFLIKYADKLILLISAIGSYAYDDSDITGQNYDSEYSSAIHSSEESYSYSKKSLHSSGPGYSYSYETSHGSSPLSLGSYGFEYASDFDSYTPLEIELDISSDLDYDTDLDYDNYFDYDLDYDPDLDPDFIKYKYRLYGLNHYGLHGPIYDDLKFRRRFKNFRRRPYFHNYGRLSNGRLGKFSPFWKYSSSPDLDLDLDVDLDLDLDTYGLHYGYDKYSIGSGDISHYLSSPISYVKFNSFT